MLSKSFTVVIQPLSTCLIKPNFCFALPPMQHHSFFRDEKSRLQGDINRALGDLNKAIDLSKDHGAAAAQAYTQRGLIHRLNREDKQAYEYFSKAAAFGSTFAKSMVVQLNPYAAMCNKMLAEAISKLKGDSL